MVLSSASASRARVQAEIARHARAPAASDAQLSLLLVSGGDERLWLDPITRRNRYGTPASPAPRELWLSSSTASAVSPRGWTAAGEALGALFTADRDRRAEIGAWFDGLRARLLGLYGAPGCEAVLSASGTEAELVVLSLALSLGLGPITNIVTAPAETGSGVPAAAGGRHFLSRASLGGAVQAGERLCAWRDAAVSVETVEIRGADGRLRPDADVDQEAIDRADRAIAAGGVALVHVLDASKTGRAGVSRAAARHIAQRHPERAIVVVDACQLRCSAAAVAADLEGGLAVMITGSKFAGGPPFCGALLLPPAMAQRLRAVSPLGQGLAGYSAALDWPAALRPNLAGGLRHPANIGLGLRWAAALAEIEAFEAVDPIERHELCAAFDAAVAERVAATPWLAPLDPDGEGPVAPGLNPIVESGGAPAKLTYETLRAHSEDWGPRLGRPIHLGQPVTVGARTALRICASMPLITEAAQRMARGASLHAALAPALNDLDLVFEKWGAIRSQNA